MLSSFQSKSGKQYAVVFMDYLTKWPEVFATSDQTSPTITKLLVEQVIARHGCHRDYCQIEGLHSSLI